MATPALGHLVRTAQTVKIESMIQSGGSLGMQTMDSHILDFDWLPPWAPATPEEASAFEEELQRELEWGRRLIEERQQAGGEGDQNSD